MAASPVIPPADHPSDGIVVRPLKDGYWDCTEIIALPEGSQRVRKRSKGGRAPGPWGIESLRREIRYLRALTPPAADHLPPLLAAWDRPGADPASPDIGYEIPFYPDHRDAGALARTGALSAGEIERFQTQLAHAVITCLHTPAAPAPLSPHLGEAVVGALESLATDPDFARLIHAPEIELNGHTVRGPRVAWEHLAHATDALASLDAAPTVRIHGDFFLENILWRPDATPPTLDAPQLVLVDPVSVAGVTAGPALFDLVKYRSYATGELLALRSEWVEVAGLETDNTSGTYRHAIRWDAPGLAPFREHDWHSAFTAAHVARHGPIDQRLYHLIDGYFSVAMAVNTFNAQRQARLLKATHDFNQAIALS